MAKTAGILVPVGLARQTQRNAQATSPTIFLPRLDFSFDDQPRSITNEATIDVLDDVFDRKNVEFVSGGSISGNVDLSYIGNLLFAFFGSVSRSGSSAQYTHTFSLRDEGIQPHYTIFSKDGDGSFAWKNAALTNLNFSFSLGSYATWSTSWVAAKYDTVRSIAPSFRNDIEYLVRKNITATYGGTPIDIRSASVSFDKSVEPDILLGENEPGGYIPTSVRMAGTVSFFLDGNVFQTEMLANTKKDIVLTCIQSSVKSMIITLKNCHIDAYNTDRSRNNIVEVTVNFTANYDTSSNTSATVVLHNQVSTHSQ